MTDASNLMSWRCENGGIAACQTNKSLVMEDERNILEQFIINDMSSSEDEAYELMDIAEMLGYL